MYAKLKNGTLTRAPREMRIGDRIVLNPREDKLLAAGYLPVNETEPPEVDERHTAVPTYEEQDGRIVQSWTVEELPPEAVSAEEIAAAIEEAMA